MQSECNMFFCTSDLEEIYLHLLLVETAMWTVGESPYRRPQGQIDQIQSVIN